MLAHILFRLAGTALAINAMVLSRQSPTGCIDPTSQEEFVWHTDCHEKNHLDANNNCPIAFDIHANTQTNCTSYCEQEVQWYYGREVPYSGTRCEANSTCTFANTFGVSVTNTWTFEAGIDLGAGGDDDKAAFNLGASYSFSKTVSTSQTLTQGRPSSTMAYCGYWTFVPFYVASCGTMSRTPSGPVSPGLHVVESLFCRTDLAAYKTKNNVCNNTPYKNADGKAGGVNVFVLTDCASNAPLNMSLQDPFYAQKGVAAPQ